MLCKLSFQNIKKSFKDYAIYFVTLILAVSIFYIFNAIESQTVLMKVTSSTREIIKLMTNMLSGVSVFVSFILGFLIIYASRFLMKRRNKEFGVYMTLGMSKGKISKILLVETIMIGVLSLIVGLVIGVFLSQIMSVFVANMFEADMSKFAFVISKSAIMKTILYFGIMYLLVMFFNVISVGKYKLIDLLNASKKSEKVKMKNPIICMVVFLISATALGYAYYMVTVGLDKINEATYLLIPIAIGGIATFFIFWSLSGLLLKLFMSMKKIYYKDLNSFTLRQISSKINTTVFSMTFICLMLFITICVLSSSLSIKNSMKANLKELAPVDVILYSSYGEENRDGFLEKKLQEWNFDTSIYFKDMVTFTTYQTDDLMIKDTLGTYLEEAKKLYPYLLLDIPEQIIKVSDYNKLATLYGMPTYKLKDDKYMIIGDYKNMTELRDESLRLGTKITLLEQTYKPAYNETKTGYIYMASNHVNGGIFLVPDNTKTDTLRSSNFLAANYQEKSKEGKRATETKLENTFKKHIHTEEQKGLIEATTKIIMYEGSVGLGALVTFIGIYLGIIFLISSAAILALKELSESTDNKERFAMLRKMGADEKMIQKALFRQIGIFFLFPLVLALIHSIFGIMFCNQILSTFGGEQILPSILMASVFLVLIYGGYFVITYLCSKNIIKEK